MDLIKKNETTINKSYSNLNHQMSNLSVTNHNPQSNLLLGDFNSRVGVITSDHKCYDDETVSTQTQFKRN